MTDQAVTQASFADFRLVKGRKVAQLVFEVPIEQADQALTALGGLPQPAAETWVALARLETRSRGQVKPLFKKEETKLSFEAAMRCRDPQFQRYCEELGYENVLNEEAAARVVRELCHIDSRSGLNTDPVAASLWRGLDGRFQAWKRGAA